MGELFVKNIGKIVSLGFLIVFLLGSFNPVFGDTGEEENIYLNFSFSSPVFEKTTIKGGIYDIIKIEDLPNTYDLGIPRLPVKAVKILLPQAILMSRTGWINLPAIAGNFLNEI